MCLHNYAWTFTDAVKLTECRRLTDDIITVIGGERISHN